MSRNEILNNEDIYNNTILTRKEKDTLKYINHQINTIPQYSKSYNTYTHIECKANDENITQNEMIRYICSRKGTITGENTTGYNNESLIILRNIRLKNTIKNLKTQGIKINSTGKKEVLIQRLIDHFNIREQATNIRNNIKRFINIAQNYIINKPKYSWQLYKNIHNKRELCVNDDDPIGCYNLNEIDKNYFYVIKENKYYYGYDIRTIFGIIYHSGWKCSKNPLTRNDFNKQIYSDCLEKFTIFKKNKLNIFYEDENTKPDTTASTEQKLLTMINKLSYELYQLDYHVSEDQIRRLNIRQYRHIYETFTNIWFFNLTNDVRMTYDNDPEERLQVPTYNDFYAITTDRTIPFNTVINYLIRILNIFYKLITTPINIEDKKTGAMYVMISLCSTNTTIRDMYPQFINVLGQ